MDQSTTHPWLGTPVVSEGKGKGSFGYVSHIDTKLLQNPVVGDSDAFFIRTSPENEVFVQNTHTTQPLPLGNAENAENDLGSLVRISGKKLEFLTKRMFKGKPVKINVELLKDPRIQPFLIYTPSADNENETVMQELTPVDEYLSICADKIAFLKQYFAWGENVVRTASDCKILICDNKPKNTVCAEIRPSVWEFRLIDLDGIQSGKTENKGEYQFTGTACVFDSSMYEDTLVINTLAFAINAFFALKYSLNQKDGAVVMFNWCMQFCNVLFRTGFDIRKNYAQEFMSEHHVNLLNHNYSLSGNYMLFVAKYVVKTFLDNKYMCYFYGKIYIQKISESDNDVREPVDDTVAP